MNRRSALVLLAILCCIGFGIRAYALTARSLWFDEAFSWRLIQFPLAEMIARDAADVHPPLYYIILQWWSVVFGTTLLSLRLFSVTAAAGTIAAGYLFTATAARSRFAGLLAAALLTFSGFQIQFAWEARMYTLGTMLVFLSSWLLLKALRTTPPKPGPWVAYAIVTAAFAYIHYYAFFSIAAQVVFLAGYLLVTTRGRIYELLTARHLWFISLAGVIMLLLYVPWIPTFLAQNSQVQDAYWIPPIGGWSIPDTFYRMFAPTPHVPRHEGIGWITLAIIPIAFTGLGLLALVTTGRRSRRTPRPTHDASWLIFTSALIPFLLSILLSFVGQSLYQDRFFVFAHLFIVVALAVLIARLPFTKIRLAVALLAILAFVVAHYSFWQQLGIKEKPGVHAATRHLFTERTATEPILVTSPFVYFGVLHYATEEFDDQSPKLYSETGELLHFAGGPILTPDDIIGPDLFTDPTHSTLWVVDTTGFGSSKLTLPEPWKAGETITYPEVFYHQGEVFVTKYTQ